MPRSLLLRQPVGVLAGQRLDERRLAVVDVPGGADASAARAAAATAAATSSTSASASVRQSSSSWPSRTIADDRWLAGAERRGERLLDARTRSSAARRAAARRRRRGATVSSTVAADERGEPLGARAHASRRPRAACAAPGSRGARAGRGRARSVPSSAASVSLSARSARCSGWRRSRSTRSARPTTMPACGPPSSLSPEKQTRSAPAARLAARTARPASGDERARAEVVDERQRRAAARRRRAPSSARRSVKPTTRKFDWCTRRSSAVSGADRALVVGGARAVRRPDLDEPRARAREHVGDAEAVADLDQLAARDDAPRGPRRARRARAAPRRRCC